MKISCSGIAVPKSGTIGSRAARTSTANALTSNGSGHIRSTWETFERTPPRKYYSLTRAGQSQLATLRREWEQLVAG